MSSTIIFKQGTKDITIDVASDKVAVFTTGTAKIWKQIAYPNYPSSWSLLDDISNEQYVSAALTVGTVIRIEAGAADVLYQVGSAPQITEILNLKYQAAPTAMTGAASITVAGLLSGIITGTQSSGATVAYTVPTGALLDLGADFAVGDSVDWSLINLSAAAADTITVTAATGHTLVGNAIVQSVHASTGLIYGSSGLFRTKKSAADTFITYRIA